MLVYYKLNIPNVSIFCLFISYELTSRRTPDSIINLSAWPSGSDSRTQKRVLLSITKLDNCNWQWVQWAYDHPSTAFHIIATWVWRGTFFAIALTTISLSVITPLKRCPCMAAKISKPTSTSNWAYTDITGRKPTLYRSIIWAASWMVLVSEMVTTGEVITSCTELRCISKSDMIVDCWRSNKGNDYITPCCARDGGRKELLVSGNFAKRHDVASPIANIE